MTISPMTISGCSIKYEFMGIPLLSVPRCVHASSRSITLSRFCRNSISVVTSVPALALNVLLGRRIAPNSSALCAMDLRTAGFSLSIVKEEVIKAMTPPGLTLSRVLAK